MEKACLDPDPPRPIAILRIYTGARVGVRKNVGRLQSTVRAEVFEKHNEALTTRIARPAVGQQ